MTYPRPYNDADYRAARAALTARPVLCSRCGEVATTIDHVPALALHDHARGSGCCYLRPACRRCNYGDASRIRRARNARGPSRAW